MINVSTHSRPKAAGKKLFYSNITIIVSTHSRPKAAGQRLVIFMFHNMSFNTQPPEGGWFC